MFSITGLDVNPYRHQVILGYIADDGASYYCELLDSSATDFAFGYTYTYDENNFTRVDTADSPGLANGELAMTFHVTATEASCSTTWPTTPQTIGGGLPTIPGTYIQFNASGLIVRLHSMLHVHSS